MHLTCKQAASCCFIGTHAVIIPVILHTFVFKHVAPVPGKTISGQATPLYCVAVPQFCSCGHPLWIFSTLGIRLGGAKPLPPGEVWKFNTSNVEKFSARFWSHLSWELSNRWWANLTNGIQNFPQTTRYKQQPSQICLPFCNLKNLPKGGCKTRFSRFWSTQQFYVWGTWRRIAHWNPQPPSGSCELLIPIAHLSRRNDSNNTELLTEVLIPKYPGQTAPGRLKVIPLKRRIISLKYISV